MNRKLITALLAALIALPATLASADLPESDAASSAAAYIQSTQEADGGFGGFGPGQTLDAVFALRAAGVDPAAVTTDGNSPADFVRANTGELTGSVGLAAKAVLASTALGLDPTDVDGTDFVAAVTGAYDDASGQYAADAFNQSLAVLGLACTGNQVPGAALDALAETQHDDGGWGFEGASDPDTTALAFQALLAGGRDVSSDAASAALAYFQASQNEDAGWGVGDAGSNANSTAFAIQVLLAAGEDPEGEAYTAGGASAVEYLVSLLQDDGSFPGFDPTFATIQVVPALMGYSYCEAIEAPISDPPAPTPTPATEPTVAPTATTTAGDQTTATPAVPETGSGTATGDAAPPWLLLAAAFVTLIAGGTGLRFLRR